MARACEHAGAGRPLRTLETSAGEAPWLAALSPLTAKPVLYVANVAEDGFGENPLAEAVEARARAEGAGAVRICAATEAELGGLDEAGRAEYLAAMGLDEPGLARFVRAAYALLDLRTFFTTGPKEARAWTLRRGMTAAAGGGGGPQRLREGVHPGRGGGLRRFRRTRGRAGREGGGTVAARRPRLCRRGRRRGAFPLRGMRPAFPDWPLPLRRTERCVAGAGIGLPLDHAGGNSDHRAMNGTGPEPAPSRPSALIPVEQARAYLLDRARRIGESERVALEDALGRVAAADVATLIDVPGHANSAMDGYAVRAADVPDDGEVTLRVTQRIAAGETGSPLAAGEAARIFTGAPVPGGADAIAIQEDCGSTVYRWWCPARSRPGPSCAPGGTTSGRGRWCSRRGRGCGRRRMGVVASVGIGSVEVCRRPRVAIVSSGNELRRPGEPLGPGQIYNSNRYTLLGLLERLGCEVVDLGTVADTLAATRDALLDGAARADLMITTGGVSVGEEDHVKRALETAGELEMWKVAVKPGKPLVYGRIGGCDLLGLPATRSRRS